MKLLPKLFFIYLLLSLPFGVKAQQQKDTIFYNKNWKITNVKDSIAFYRITTKVNSNYNVRDYYVNKTLQMTGSFVSIEKDIRDGYFKYYDESGKLLSEGNYKKNLKNGVWKNYKKNKLLTETHFINDTMHGSFIVYYPNGIVKRNEVYKNGEFINGLCYSQNGNDTAYFPFEILPKYFEGDEDLSEGINYYLEYPKFAIENKIEGEVILKFYVDIDGSIKDIKVLSNSPDILNQSAIKGLMKMPKWNPGKLDGIPLRVYFTLPIVFKLDH